MWLDGHYSEDEPGSKWLDYDTSGETEREDVRYEFNLGSTGTLDRDWANGACSWADYANRCSKILFAWHYLNWAQQYYHKSILPAKSNSIGIGVHNNNILPLKFELNSEGCMWTVAIPGMRDFTIKVQDKRSCYLGGWDGFGIQDYLIALFTFPDLVLAMPLMQAQPEKIWYWEENIHFWDNLVLWHEYGHVVQDLTGTFTVCPAFKRYSYQEGYADFLAVAMEKGNRVWERMGDRFLNSPQRYHGAGLFQDISTWDNFESEYKKGNIFAGTNFELMNLVGNEMSQKLLLVQYAFMDDEWTLAEGFECLASIGGPMSDTTIKNWWNSLEVADLFVNAFRDSTLPAPRYSHERYVAYSDHGMSAEKYVSNYALDKVTNENYLGNLLQPLPGKPAEAVNSLSATNIADQYLVYQLPGNEYVLEVKSVRAVTAQFLGRGIGPVTSSCNSRKIGLEKCVIRKTFRQTTASDGRMLPIKLIQPIPLYSTKYQISVTTVNAGSGSPYSAFPIAATKGVTEANRERFTISDVLTNERRSSYFRYYVPAYMNGDRRGTGANHEYPQDDSTREVSINVALDDPAAAKKPWVIVYPTNGEDTCRPKCPCLGSCNVTKSGADFDSAGEMTIKYERCCAQNENVTIVFVSAPFEENPPPYETNFSFYVTDWIDRHFHRDQPRILRPRRGMPPENVERVKFANKLYINYGSPISADPNEKLFDSDFYTFTGLENQGYTVDVVPLWGNCRPIQIDLEALPSEDRCSQMGGPDVTNPDVTPGGTLNNLRDSGYYDNRNNRYSVECKYWWDFNRLEEDFRNQCHMIDRGFLFDGVPDPFRTGGIPDFHNRIANPNKIGARRIKFVAPYQSLFLVRVGMMSDDPRRHDVNDFECGYVIDVKTDNTVRPGLPDYVNL